MHRSIFFLFSRVPLLSQLIIYLIPTLSSIETIFIVHYNALN